MKLFYTMSNRSADLKAIEGRYTSLYVLIYGRKLSSFLTTHCIIVIAQFIT